MPLTTTAMVRPMWDCGRSTKSTGVNAMAEMLHAILARISSVQRKCMHGAVTLGNCGQLIQSAAVDPFINRLQAAPIDSTYQIDPCLPTKIFYKKLEQSSKSLEIFIAYFGKLPVNDLLINFVGTESATINTWECIKLFNPDLVINPGTAGGLKKIRC